MIVVIDGPAGSGKSSTAKAVAEKLQIQYLDSGALYRVATLIFLESGKDLNLFLEQLKENKISFHFKEKIFHVFLNGMDVTESIRKMKVSENVSEVASMPEVRAHINDLMRKVVSQHTYIADGRDLGTAVFPDADLKFYMIADLETRAQRRQQEMETGGISASYDEIKQNIAQRDEMDINRKADPLKKAGDAIEIDTSILSFDEQVDKICKQIQKIKQSKQQKP